MHLILIDNKSTLFQIQNEVKYSPLPEIKSGFVYPVPNLEREYGEKHLPDRKVYLS